MNKTIEYFKKKQWQIAPTAFALVMILCGFLFNLATEGKTCTATIGSVIYNDIGCNKVIGHPIEAFFIASFVGLLVLLFTRNSVVRLWSIFFGVYLVVAVVVLYGIAPTSSWFDRTSYSLGFGALLSVITILWAIIHSLIIRRSEKAASPTNPTA